MVLFAFDIRIGLTCLKYIMTLTIKSPLAFNFVTILNDLKNEV